MRSLRCVWPTVLACLLMPSPSLAWVQPQPLVARQLSYRTIRPQSTALPRFARGVAARRTPLAAASLSVLDNMGLLMLSVTLVKVLYTVLAPKKATSDEQSAGVMDRCPWPFIFSHDVKQGLKDSPTWMVVLFFVLRVVLKRIRRTVVV